MPSLTQAQAQKAERLPPITDPSLAGQVAAGIDADRSYNDLALRYNRLVDLWACVKASLDAGKVADDCFTK